MPGKEPTDDAPRFPQAVSNPTQPNPTQPNPSDLTRRHFLTGVGAGSLAAAFGSMLAFPSLGKAGEIKPICDVEGCIGDEDPNDPRLGFGLDSFLENHARTFDEQELLSKVTGDGDSTNKPYEANGTYDSGTDTDFASGAGTFAFNGAYMGDYLGSFDGGTKFGRFELRDYEDRKLILDVDLRDVQFSDVLHVTGYRQNNDGTRVSIDAWFDFIQEKWVGGNSSDIIVGPVFDELGRVMQNAFPGFHPSIKEDPDGFEALRLDDFLCAGAVVAVAFFCFIFGISGNLCDFFRRLCRSLCAHITNTRIQQFLVAIGCA